MEVNFYNSVDDARIRFAVIVAEYRGRWIFCKHRERSTYEIPGGHREPGEAILDTAKRELFEETGASQFKIAPVCVYSVTGKNNISRDGRETFGMLYYAVIDELSALPKFEMEKIEYFKDLPLKLTYPFIQPPLFDKAREYIKIVRESNALLSYYP